MIAKAQKPVIAVDIDDTALDFLTPLNAWHNRAYGTKLRPHDYWTYDLHKIWKCSPEEGGKRVDEFYKSPEFAAIRPMPGAEIVIPLLAQEYDLVNVTARKKSLLEETTTCMNTLFPGCIREVRCSDAYKDYGKLKKVDVCKQIGAGIFIEDHLKYAMECAAEGIKVFMLPFHWNNPALITSEEARADFLAHVQRLPTWYEIGEEILGREIPRK